MARRFVPRESPMIDVFAADFGGLDSRNVARVLEDLRDRVIGSYFGEGVAYRIASHAVTFAGEPGSSLSRGVASLVVEWWTLPEEPK